MPRRNRNERNRRRAERQPPQPKQLKPPKGVETINLTAQIARVRSKFKSPSERLDHLRVILENTAEGLNSRDLAEVFAIIRKSVRNSMISHDRLRPIVQLALKRLRPKMMKLRLQDSISVVKDLAALKVTDAALLSEIADSLARHLGLLATKPPQSIVHIAQSASSLGEEAREIVRQLVRIGVRKVSALTSGDSLSLVRAAVDVEMKESRDIFYLIKPQLMSRLISKDDGLLIHHLAILLDDPLNPHLREAANQGLKSVKANRPNRFETQVGQAVAKRGYTVLHEQVIEGFPVDILIANVQPMHIIECDGSEFHLVDPGGAGPMIQRRSDSFRDRVLRKKGYAISRVSDLEWRDESSKESFLDRLSKELVIVPTEIAEVV